MADSDSKKRWTVVALVGGLVLAIAVFSSLDNGSGVTTGVLPPGGDPGAGVAPPIVAGPGANPAPAPNPTPAPFPPVNQPAGDGGATGDDPVIPAAAPTTKTAATRGGRSRLDLAYLPPDSQMIVKIKVSAVWESPFVQGLLGAAGGKSLAQVLQTRIGLSPTDIESITAGTPGIWGRAPAQDSFGIDTSKLFVAVVRSKKELSPETLKLRENGCEKLLHDSKTYFRLPAIPGKTEKLALFLPNSSVVVIGEEIALQAAIERGERGFQRPELNFVDADQQVVVALVPRDMATLFPPPTKPRVPADGDDPADVPLPPPETGISRLKEVLTKYSGGFGLSVNFGEGIDLRAYTEAAHGDGAKRIKQALGPAVTDARIAFKAMQARLPLQFIHLVEFAFTNLKVSEQGKLVSVVCSLPGSLRSDFEKIPQAFGFSMGGSLPGMGAMAKGDEAPGVPPVNTEGIPEGLTLQAKACWGGESGGTDAKQRNSGRLEVLIDLHGELAAEVVAYGRLKMNSITADDDKSLKLLKLPAPFGEDPTTQWIMVDHNDLSSPHPDDGVRVRCLIERPKQSITKITSFDGELQLRTADASLEKTLENVNEFIGKTVPDPELVQAGFKLKSNEGKELVASVNKDLLLGKLHAYNASDDAIPNTFGMSGESKGTPIQSIVFANGKIPPNLTLKFALHGGLKMVRVPFKFADVPVVEVSSSDRGLAGGDSGSNSRGRGDKRGAGSASLSVDSAKLRPGNEWSANDLQMKFCWCPAGWFMMGSPKTEDGRDNHEAQARVTLTRGFWIGKNEVTQKEWQKVMGTQPWNGQSGIKVGPTFPATFVNWDDAAAFCRKFTEQERAEGRLPAGWEYRLPTEAQWEYACRAGSKARYTFGENTAGLPTYAWFQNTTTSEKYPHEVGKKKANAWKLQDVHGNVWEWCQDSYADRHPGGSDPETRGSSSHVARGGSFTRDWSLVRSAAAPQISNSRAK